MGVNNSSDIIHCDEEAGGETMTQRSLPNSPPPVYTIVLEWASASISSKDIMATFAALSTDIDLADLYGVNDAQGKHRLVSMVCCNGQHNCCFTCNEDHDQWIMYDDEIVKVIGSWNDVTTLCGGLCMHPQVLFFEDLNSTKCPSGYSSMSRLLMEREKQMKNNLLSHEIVEFLGTPKRSILSFFSSERSIRYRKLLKRQQDLSFVPSDRLESEELVNKVLKFHRIRKVTTFMGMNKLFKTKSR